MPSRFEKFTERARKVLSLSQEEAQSFNHDYIGTEHILLGLVREGEGVAAKVLISLGVELDKVRSAVEYSLLVVARNALAVRSGLPPGRSGLSNSLWTRHDGLTIITSVPSISSSGYYAKRKG